MMLRRDFKKTIFGIFTALVFVVLFSSPAIAQNGSLYLSPSSGNVSVGQTFSLVLRVNTGGTAINAAEGSVIFDPQKLDVVSLSKSGSIFTIWATDPKFSNAEGTVEFAGGIPNPGYSGSNGLVLTITFKTQAATSVSGSTEISLVSGGILANDGYGTNILSSLGKATYAISPSVITPVPTVAPKEPAPEEPAVTASGPSQINITSSTHPDSSKWYSNSNPLFKWEAPSGTNEVILVLSHRVNSPPIINYIPPISEKLLTDIEDGEWYLNGRFRTSAGLGPVTSFKFNIDTRPPADFSITRVDTDDPTNPKPELLFSSSDETSGIDHYELTVNGTDPVNIAASDAGKSYAMPLQTPGEKNLEIKAFDKAGNTASARLTIQIQSIKKPILKEVSEKVKEGESVVVKGVAKPGQKVIIYVARISGESNIRFIGNAYADNANGGTYKAYEAVADENGNFKLEITGLPAGNYSISVAAEDERGAVSLPSDSKRTEVKRGLFDWIFKIFDRLANIFDRFVSILSGGALFIAFLATLVGLIISLIKLFETQIRKWWQVIYKRRKIKVGEKRSTRTLAHIKSDLKKELDILREIGKNRKLTPQEKFLRSRMKQDLKNPEGLDLIDKQKEK